MEVGSLYLEQCLGGLVVLDVFINAWLPLLQSQPEVPEQDGIPHHYFEVIVKMHPHQVPYVILHLGTKVG